MLGQTLSFKKRFWIPWKYSSPVLWINCCKFLSVLHLGPKQKWYFSKQVFLPENVYWYFFCMLIFYEIKFFLIHFTGQKICLFIFFSCFTLTAFSVHIIRIIILLWIKYGQVYIALHIPKVWMESKYEAKQKFLLICL